MEANHSGDILQSGDMLNWYRIEHVLGRGGFGVTYLATDTNLETKVAIKEYLPDLIAQRDPDNSLRPSSLEATSTFEWGLDRFVKEARTLARFKHPNIVRVFSVFEANQTAYMVMEYERGTVLKDYLLDSANSTEKKLKQLFEPVLDGLKQIHEAGFIHRDIKPANIMVREDSSPVLIDFGSARQSYADQTQTLTTLVSVGYAPLEQYSDSADDKQGPWTDIYACGAVLYYAISGNPPLDATRRGSAVINNSADPLEPISKIGSGRFSTQFLEAIDWALSFTIAERPQDVSSWMNRLFSTAPTALPSIPATDDDKTVLKPRVPVDSIHATHSNVSQDDQTTSDVWNIPIIDQSTLPLSAIATDDWDLSTIDRPRRTNSESAKRAKSRSMFLLVPFFILGAVGIGYFAINFPTKYADIKDINNVSNDKPAVTVSTNFVKPTENEVGSELGSTTKGANPETTPLSIASNQIVENQTKDLISQTSALSEKTNPAASIAETSRAVANSRNVDSASTVLAIENAGNEKLDTIMRAIETTNLDQLKNVATLSESSVKKFTVLFQHFDRINARYGQIDLRMRDSANQSGATSTTLTLDKLVRADGSTARPAQSLETFILDIRVVDATSVSITL